jgi:Fe-S oxidoreductase
MLSQVYSKLVPGAAAEKVSKSSVPFFQFIQDELPDLQIQPSESTHETLGFHIACHDRALTSGLAARRFLERVGYHVQVVETGTCCGMGGTFGMKHGPLGYDLSMAVGERLFKLFRESGCKLIATESSVCAMQLADGLSVKVVHPLKLATLSTRTA